MVATYNYDCPVDNGPSAAGALNIGAVLEVDAARKRASYSPKTMNYALVNIYPGAAGAGWPASGYLAASTLLCDSKELSHPQLRSLAE
ncbi:hypothetical protein EVAR_65556_1 [Eumeta japonica]|uniref:Uncharacterized protein n=1 Tax=Eumeta variegata TaxID=151549 RepID=A0A4C1Z732_EUMVA|nr:hypothetical protein EVAR_65556_1 [Eumeta japonica]